jgi:hypothetical protein
MMSTDYPDGHYKYPEGNRPDGKICPFGWICRKFENYFPEKKNLARSDGPGSRPNARVSDYVLDTFLGFLSL